MWVRPGRAHVHHWNSHSLRHLDGFRQLLFSHPLFYLVDFRKIISPSVEIFLHPKYRMGNFRVVSSI